jgi:hypothetical protein
MHFPMMEIFHTLAREEAKKEKEKKVAEFCWQCTEALGAKGEQNDFVDLSRPPEAQIHTERAFGVVCEGCGPTLVDAEGRCVSEVCEKHGRKR